MTIERRRVVQGHADQRGQSLLGRGFCEDHAMSARARRRAIARQVHRGEHAVKSYAVRMARDFGHSNCESIEFQVCVAPPALNRYVCVPRPYGRGYSLSRATARFRVASCDDGTKIRNPSTSEWPQDDKLPAECCVLTAEGLSSSGRPRMRRTSFTVSTPLRNRISCISASSRSSVASTTV